MMNRSRSSKSRPPGILLAAALGLAGTLAGAGAQAEGLADLFDGRLPNNFPFLNSAGTAATFSTAGFVDLTNPFHSPQGSNGRSCESCHLPQVGWSIRPVDVELKFLLTRGEDPIFNPLDANSPTPDVSSLQAKRASYSMLRKGLFRRGGTIPAAGEFEIAEFDDPLGAGGKLPTTVQTYRRPLATANFHIAQNIGWHDQNTDGSATVPVGLFRQADGNIIGAQGGPQAPKAIVDEIVSYELGLAFAQQFSFGAGLLTACGAKGGPENLSAQLPAKGRFDLFDAWKDLRPGSCGSRAADRKRAQIARGQQVFNGEVAGVTGNCSGCHNAVNNGSNVDARLFDIHASQVQNRKDGMPLYTMRNKTSGETHQTTDPGRALRSGKWADMDRFKVPSLRGAVARAPYFHNGIAANLDQVVRHYEVELGFRFDDAADRQALIAFLEAL